MSNNYWHQQYQHPQSRQPAVAQQDQNLQFTPCPQLPGTLLRVFIPAGAVINLLNLLEVTSPSGICLIVRIPALGGAVGSGPFQGLSLENITNMVQQAGGTVEQL